ncbi:MAG: hypothetical protein DYG98_22305 [Haliscomenobacteraceae bacterium CHB4]|nr:hypothetical protein [Saprospiraceae bacterium]MCE7925793.1 hypothetical protein [Haliscomenobacteraceae bacterium CHB4]
MRRLKFLTLFRTLREEEVAAFQKYLKRLHGNDEVALDVFAYLKKFYPGFREEKKLELGNIYRKVFEAGIEENEYNHKKLLNALSDLYLWLKAFLLSEKMNDGSFESRFLWLKVLKERGLEYEFLNGASVLQTELNDLSKQRSVADYGKCLAINHFVYNHLTEDKSTPQSEAFLPFAANLDLYYAVTKLKTACEMVNLKNMKLPVPAPDFLFDIPAIPDSPTLAAHPLLLLYREVYQLLSSRRDEHYSRVEAILTEQAGKIAPLELGVILIYLRNFASLDVRTGEEQLWGRTHRLNKLGVEHGVFIRRGSITTTEFHNIVNAAGKAEDFDWADRFIAGRSQYLPAEVRAHAVLLANAILLFEKKDFAAIVKELDRVNLKELHDLHLLIRLKTMMLRCYYELGEDPDTILNYCTNFENNLHRLRQPRTEAIKATFNFMKLLKMLVRKKTAKDLVLKKIENTKPAFFKPWLLEKAVTYKAAFATRKRGM